MRTMSNVHKWSDINEHAIICHLELSKAFYPGCCTCKFYDINWNWMYTKTFVVFIFQDHNGKLLLHEACKSGLDVIVELLLDAGINPDSTDISTVKCSSSFIIFYDNFFRLQYFLSDFIYLSSQFVMISPQTKVYSIRKITKTKTC